MKTLLIFLVCVLSTGCASHSVSHSRAQLERYMDQCLQPGQFLREQQPPQCEQVAGVNYRAMRQARAMRYK